MSVIKHEIDGLLPKTEQGAHCFAHLLQRLCDINNIAHGQHLRVTACSGF